MGNRLGREGVAAEYHMKTDILFGRDSAMLSHAKSATTQTIAVRTLRYASSFTSATRADNRILKLVKERDQTAWVK